MSSILANNVLHHAYWRSSGSARATITADASEDEGFEFRNAIDDTGHSVWKLGGGTIQRIVITLPASQKCNGFMVYGHNLRTDQGLNLQYDTVENASPSTPFADSPYTGQLFYPENNLGMPFGAKFDSELTVRSLEISTQNWDSDSYISVLSVGAFIDGVNLAAPFTPPLFRPYDQEIKFNDNASPMLGSVRQKHQKLTLNLTTLAMIDLESLGNSDQLTTTINGEQKNWSFIEYLGNYLPRHPFALMWDEGLGAADDAEIRQRRSKMYWCTADGAIEQPQYNSPTTLNWQIKAKGFL